MKLVARYGVRPGAFLILAVLLLSTACEDDVTGSNPRFTAEAPFSFEVQRAARTELRLEGVNGTIEITGDPAATSVSVTGMRRVESDSQEDADAHLPDLTVDVDSTDTSVIVRTEQPSVSSGRGYIVDYTISLPVTFTVNAVNANGEISVNTLTSDVVIHNANGRIRATAIEGNATMGLANGEIIASVTIPDGGTIEANVANGEIILGIPQTTSAEFSAMVATGSITTTNLTLSNITQTPTSLTGTLGDGDGSISLGVGNGTITVDGF
jgi:hypothetical protein